MLFQVNYFDVNVVVASWVRRLMVKRRLHFFISHFQHNKAFLDIQIQY
jgi:hypothetical protein